MLWLMFIEWPAVSFICAFMAAQWFFSFGIVYLLSIFGDLIGDILWYCLWRFARRFWAKKLLAMKEKWEIIDIRSLPWRSRISLWVAIKMQNLEKKPLFVFIHKKMKKNFFLALFLVKITPPLSIPGQISFWFFRVPFKKFLFQTTGLIILFESIFLNLGYFSSMSANVFKHKFDTVSFIISAVVIWWLALWWWFLIIKRIRKLSHI